MEFPVLGFPLESRAADMRHPHVCLAGKAGAACGRCPHAGFDPSDLVYIHGLLRRAAQRHVEEAMLSTWPFNCQSRYVPPFKRDEHSPNFAHFSYLPKYPWSHANDFAFLAVQVMHIVSARDLPFATHSMIVAAG